MERRRQMAQQMPLGYPGGGGMYAAPRYPYRRGYGGGMGGMGMGMRESERLSQGQRSSS